MRVHPRRLAAMAAGVVAWVGCRHPARTAPAPARGREQYCWWTAWHTSLPPDTVVARFEQAFASLGLSPTSRGRAADTVWAQAGPARLDRAPAGASYESRIVAFRYGDTTAYRQYVSVAPPAGGWAAADTGRVTERTISFCGDIGRAAGVRAWAYRDPTAEDSLDVWRRRP